MYMQQVSVFVENKSGRLSEITGVLARENIDIRALSIADTTDFGILRLIVDDPERAVAVLKIEGYTVSKTNVLAISIDDKPGALHYVLNALYTSGIGLEYSYAFITRKAGAYVILRVEDNERATQILRDAGVTLLSPSDVYDI